MPDDPPHFPSKHSSMCDDLINLHKDSSSLNFPESLPFGRPGSLSIGASAQDYKADVAHQLEYRIARSEGSVDGPHDRKGSDSEEAGKETMTPAQSRRKAQNRAAQRAFRERKERHVRELEHKLAQTEAASLNLKSDNARLKHALQRATMENEILRARAMGTQTSPSATPLDSPTLAFADALSAPPFEFVSDATQNSFDFFSLQRPRPASLPGSSHTLGQNWLAQMPLSSQYPADCDMNLHYPPVNREAMLARSSGQSRLLSAQETWDYIHATPLYQRGLVDLADVVARLKAVACERAGQGEPSFDEADVNKAVEDAARETGFYSGESVGGFVNITDRSPLEEHLD